jgi:hypothetical protein
MSAHISPLRSGHQNQWWTSVRGADRGLPLPHRYDNDDSASCTVISDCGDTMRCSEGTSSVHSSAPLLPTVSHPTSICFLAPVLDPVPLGGNSNDGVGSGTPHLCQSRHNSTCHGWGGGFFGVRRYDRRGVTTAALEPTLLHSLLCHGLRSPKLDPSFILPPCYDQPWSMDRYFHSYHNQCPDTFSQWYIVQTMFFYKLASIFNLRCSFLGCRLQVLGWANIKQLKSQFFLCT